MSKIQRNNTVIDPSRSTDLATAISKYTSGGVMLTDAIAELAKSLTILLQDQMGYSNFKKRYNSCKFDLHRECFYFWGHDAYTGELVSHIIHEWPSAGDDFTFGDGVTGRTASRTEIRQFAKDLPGFLEKLRDDLMSTGAESEEKAEMIACLADRLRECNLIILKRQQDRPDRGPFFPVPEQVTEDNQIEPMLETAMNAILKIDEVDQTLPQPYRDRHTEYAGVLWKQLAEAFRRGVDQGAAGQRMLEDQKGPAMGGKSYEERIKERDDLLDTYRDQEPPYDEGQLAAISVLWMEKELKTALIAIDYYKSVKDTITLSPSPCSSFTSSMLVEAKRIDVGDAVGKCPVCGAYMDLLRLTVAGTVVAYMCPNGHTYLFSHKGTDVDQVGGELTAAAYIQPLPASSVEEPIPVIVERVLLLRTDGSQRLCGQCEKSIDLVRITVAGTVVAIIGVCADGHTYLYPPSEFHVGD